MQHYAQDDMVPDLYSQCLTVQSESLDFKLDFRDLVFQI